MQDEKQLSLSEIQRMIETDYSSIRRTAGRADWQGYEKEANSYVKVRVMSTPEQIDAFHGFFPKLRIERIFGKNVEFSNWTAYN